MKQTIKGRIATDIVITETVKGNRVANFRIADNGKRKTEFFRMVGWNGLAKALQRRLRKGDLVKFETEAEVSCWIDGKGKAQAEHILTVRSFEFIRRPRHRAH